jgi:Fis family transcriptional regulator
MNQPPSASPDDLLPATPLRHHVYEALRIYFHNLGDQQPSNLYDLVLREMESPLLEIVMLRTQGNQSQAATLLGINRGTLRKKLRQHGIDATNESTYTSIITEQAHESGNFRP